MTTQTINNQPIDPHKAVNNNSISSFSNRGKAKQSIFVAKSVNEWLSLAQTLPEPQSLYDQLWFENETAFLFGGTGIGKSLMAVQIGKKISNHQPVVYFDFELSVTQFANRYLNENRDFQNFPENFIRVEFERDIVYKQETLIEEIKNTSIQHNAKILIIDNLTWLLSGAEKSFDAGNLMKEIAELKRNHGLSILILAHTPKRDESRPVTINDMAGSMQLNNFIDTSFCIAKSFQSDNRRYIKQVKVRSTELHYGYESVLVLDLVKSESGFLGFNHIGTERESDHLRRPTEDDFTTKKQECYKLLDDGKSYTDIQKATGLARGTITKYKKQREDEDGAELPF